MKRRNAIRSILIAPLVGLINMPEKVFEYPGVKILKEEYPEVIDILTKTIINSKQTFSDLSRTMSLATTKMEAFKESLNERSELCSQLSQEQSLVL